MAAGAKSEPAKEIEMKVREVIKIAGWVDGNGWTYKQKIFDEVVEIGDSIPDEIEWDWYDLPDDYEPRDLEDTLITVEYYDEDADLSDYPKPLTTYNVWESVLIEERNIE